MTISHGPGWYCPFIQFVGDGFQPHGAVLIEKRTEDEFHSLFLVRVNGDFGDFVSVARVIEFVAGGWSAAGPSLLFMAFNQGILRFDRQFPAVVGGDDHVDSPGQLAAWFKA
ncbi:MAG TPA: hypothetical protein VFE47_15590 [Tepidisphaeraceae bacterium]|nr:hypothetical protein [Tepidisphaeraceae bacterium]